MIGRHGADCFGRERVQDGRCHPGGDALLSRPPLVPAADANANGNGNASASASASASWPAGRVGGQSAAQHRAGGASGRVCSGVGRSIVRCGVHARASHSTCQIFRQQARAAISASPQRPCSRRGERGRTLWWAASRHRHRAVCPWSRASQQPPCMMAFGVPSAAQRTQRSRLVRMHVCHTFIAWVRHTLVAPHQPSLPRSCARMRVRVCACANKSLAGREKGGRTKWLLAFRGMPSWAAGNSRQQAGSTRCSTLSTCIDDAFPPWRVRNAQGRRKCADCPESRRPYYPLGGVPVRRRPACCGLLAVCVLLLAGGTGALRRRGRWSQKKSTTAQARHADGNSDRRVVRRV